MKMENKITESDLALLMRIRDYLAPSNAMNALYTPPAQELRNAADRMEKQEQDVEELQRFIAKVLDIVSPSPTHVTK